MTLDKTTIYEHYPDCKEQCDYLTGKTQSADFGALQKFYNRLKADGVVLNISYMDVKPGVEGKPFFCNGIQSN